MVLLHKDNKQTMHSTTFYSIHPLKSTQPDLTSDIQT